MSKKGKCFFSLTISEISRHCASVGSIPVGFWGSALTLQLDCCCRQDRKARPAGYDPSSAQTAVLANPSLDHSWISLSQNTSADIDPPKGPSRVRCPVPMKRGEPPTHRLLNSTRHTRFEPRLRQKPYRRKRKREGREQRERTHVGTSMQQDDGSFRRGLDVGLHALKVEPDSVFVKVSVSLAIHT
jgi:hypothetical protein